MFGRGPAKMCPEYLGFLRFPPLGSTALGHLSALPQPFRGATGLRVLPAPNPVVESRASLQTRRPDRGGVGAARRRQKARLRPRPLSTALPADPQFGPLAVCLTRISHTPPVSSSSPDSVCRRGPSTLNHFSVQTKVPVLESLNDFS